MAIDFAKSGWDGDLNDFIEANSISDTGWVTDGIVMENGWATDPVGDPLKYRVLTFGSSRLMFITGWAYPTADVALNAKADIAQFPAGAKIGSTQFGASNVKGGLGELSFSPDGVLSYTLYGASMTANNGFYLNMMVLDK